MNSNAIYLTACFSLNDLFLYSVESSTFTATANSRVLDSPPEFPPTEEIKEKKITAQDFLEMKKKEDNYEDQLLIQLIPLFREFSFLPQRVVESCTKRVLNWIYSQKHKD